MQNLVAVFPTVQNMWGTGDPPLLIWIISDHLVLLPRVTMPIWSLKSNPVGVVSQKLWERWGLAHLRCGHGWPLETGPFPYRLLCRTEHVSGAWADNLPLSTETYFRDTRSPLRGLLVPLRSADFLPAPFSAHMLWCSIRPL